VYLVSISGSCSRSGKTAAAVSLLAAMPPGRATAVKFTTTEDVFDRCPRGTTCVVCDIDVPFRIIEDPQVLGQSGTDTARLAGAGATRVIWAIARHSAVADAWAAVRARLATDGLVVMEGSTITAHARPDLHLAVVHPHLAPERWKATTEGCLAAADLVVLNRPAADRRAPSKAVRACLARLRPDAETTTADVTAPAATWAPAFVAAMDAHARTEAVPA
jgi:hypothetical protein